MYASEYSRTLFCCILPVVGILFLRSLKGRAMQLPPGPPQVPILGNIHQVPDEYQYYRFTEWARTYGT